MHFLVYLQVPSQMSCQFEVCTTIDNESRIVYTGDQLKCTVSGLKPRQEVSVQVIIHNFSLIFSMSSLLNHCHSSLALFEVRVILLDSDGHQIEGDWSAASSALTLPEPPQTPKNVHLNEDQ